MTTPLRSDFPGAAMAAPLSIRDISALLERLPAGDRAALSWAPAALQHEIQPLREGPLTSDIVSSSTVAAFRVFAALMPSVMKVLGTERFFSEADGAHSDALERLRWALPDAGSKRSAEWVVAALQRFTRFISRLPSEELARMDVPTTLQDGFVDFLHGEPAGVLRAAVLLMAAMSIADQGGDPERAAELCDLAFLNATDAADHLALAGIVVAPEMGAAERGLEILDAVEEARATLAPEDIVTLSSARLRDLR
jgi:hypothetical protein